MHILAASLFLVSFTAVQVNAASINSSTDSFPTDLQPFIVGGEKARRNEFPWLVHLTIDGKSFCGGALIKLDVVLTAAHCVYRVSAGKIKVVAGDHDRLVKETTEQSGEGKSVKWHEQYYVNERNKTILHDIAVVKLKKAFKRTDYKYPISLPSANASITARTGVAAGWGSTVYGGGINSTLYKVSVPIVTNITCWRQLANNNTQFCAGAIGKDSCQGDSGGPFLCSNSSKEVCGIVSYGTGCGWRDNPGVYTKVSAYVSWINKNGSSSVLLISHIVMLVSVCVSVVFRH